MSEPGTTATGAWIGRDALADGLAAIARKLAYSNFKSEVGHRDPERANVARR